MPELAEVKLVSEFVTKHGVRKFLRAEKSPVSKVTTDLTIGSPFNLKSTSRGKEMVIDVVATDASFSKRLKIALGMSGTWIYYDPSDPKTEKFHKHTHLRFVDENECILGLHDTRRFAKWSWRDFDPNRGHCPLTDHENFRSEILANWQTNSDFKKPLSETVMNQRWFNGVGNYLRAEILHRLDLNPFSNLNELTEDDVKRLTDLTQECVSTAYQLGGGQLKDWKNPSGESPASFREWIKCYGKLEHVLDGTGRTFWFDKK